MVTCQACGESVPHYAIYEVLRVSETPIPAKGAQGLWTWDYSAYTV